MVGLGVHWPRLAMPPGCLAAPVGRGSRSPWQIWASVLQEQWAEQRLSALSWAAGGDFWGGGGCSALEEQIGSVGDLGARAAFETLPVDEQQEYVDEALTEMDSTCHAWLIQGSSSVEEVRSQQCRGGNSLESLLQLGAETAGSEAAEAWVPSSFVCDRLVLQTAEQEDEEVVHGRFSGDWLSQSFMLGSFDAAGWATTAELLPSTPDHDCPSPQNALEKQIRSGQCFESSPFQSAETEPALDGPLSSSTCWVAQSIVGPMVGWQGAAGWPPSRECRPDSCRDEAEAEDETIIGGVAADAGQQDEGSPEHMSMDMKWIQTGLVGEGHAKGFGAGMLGLPIVAPVAPEVQGTAEGLPERICAHLAEIREDIADDGVDKHFKGGAPEPPVVAECAAEAHCKDEAAERGHGDAQGAAPSTPRCARADLRMLLRPPGTPPRQASDPRARRHLQKRRRMQSVGSPEDHLAIVTCGHGLSSPHRLAPSLVFGLNS